MRPTSFFAAALLLIACKPTDKPANAPARLDFVTQVRPLLENRCINCHHAGALMGHLNLETRAKAFSERPGGPVIIPGDPEASRFYQVLNLPVTDQQAMPPEGHRIPDAEKETLKTWIAQGADWPEGADGILKPLPPIQP